MIRFCTEEKQMLNLLKEFQRNHVCYHIFRNLDQNMKYKGKTIKYIFFIKEKPKTKKDRSNNSMMWWKKIKVPN